jgi:phage terminase large subunit GpA-like protein
MRKCKWWQFHKWDMIYNKTENTFMGEKYFDYDPYYKKCKKCGEVRRFRYDCSVGYWEKLSDNETRIFNKHIVIDTHKNCLIVY